MTLVLLKEAEMRLSLSCLALLLAALGSPVLCSSNSSELRITIDTSGPFSISIGEDKDIWITSAEYGVRMDGKLLILGKDLTSNESFGGDGEDALGAYQYNLIKWKTKDKQEDMFETNIKVYTDLNAVVFEQHFPIEVMQPKGGESSDLLSAFPTFTSSDEAITPLNYITYGGTFPQMHLGHFNNHSAFPGGTSSGVPLALFDKSMRTLVISPLDNFMVGMQAVGKEFGKDAIVCGINGKIQKVPANFSHSTIMWAGQGLRETMHGWGGALLKYHGKTRTPLDSDFSVKYLGWWTDNGGYYHYQTETGKNYQQTMLDAKAKLKELNIPARYFQLDSWWYFKEGTRGAVTLWEPMPDVFPDGMSDWLGEPLSLHNRWFAAKNNYSSDWFLVEEGEDCALPSSQKLYDVIMGKTVKWGPGMFQYEQDWLVTTFERCAYAQTDIYAASNWLKYMSDGAAALNVTIQYCMALPNHMLQSVALQPVTVSRASGDYSASSEQWAIGKTSLLYHSIGIIPFKDCFQTVSVNESGCPHHPHCQETNPALQALASTMSTGPIAPADGIQFMNEDTATLLKRTCRWADGLIFKPDVPAIEMDAAFQTVFDDAHMDLFNLWHTYSNYSGARYHYVIAEGLDEPFELSIGDLGEPINMSFMVYDYFESCSLNATSCSFTNELMHLSFSKKLTINVPKDTGIVTPSGIHLKLHPFKYYVIAPVLPNGWAFLGEGMKFAAVSKQRFTSITGEDGESLVVTMTGTEGEEITVSAVGLSHFIVSATGKFGPSLKATVECHFVSPTVPKCTFVSD